MKILRHQLKTRDQTQKQPAMIFFFGGGFISGNAESQAPSSCAMAESFNCTVFTVDYQVSPESKAPNTGLDCYAATKYILKNAAEWGLDTDRIVIGGESSGANVTACVCMELAKNDESKLIKYAWLDVPAVSSHWLERTEDLNYVEAASKEGHLNWLSMTTEDWKASCDSKDPNIFPCNMGDELAAKCPPTFVSTREFDHFRRDAEEYATLMQKHGKLLGECYI
jgi:acetyl esterase